MSKSRGTTPFNFNGKAISLRLDMQGIEDVEEISNTPIARLGYNAGVSGGMKLKDMKAIVWAGIAGHYRNENKEELTPTITEVGEFILSKGLVNTELVANVLGAITSAITTTDEIESMSKKKESES